MVEQCLLNSVKVRAHMERWRKNFHKKGLNQPQQHTHHKTNGDLSYNAKNLTIGLPLNFFIKHVMPSNQHRPQPNTILNRFSQSIKKYRTRFCKRKFLSMKNTTILTIQRNTNLPHIKTKSNTSHFHNSSFKNTNI